MNPFIKRLIDLGEISEEEQAAMLAACQPPVRVAAGEDLVQDGSQPGFSMAILSGIAFRYKGLDQGRRQIISFQVPGNGVDLYAYALRRLDHGVQALTACEVSHIPHSSLDQLISIYPRLALTLWRETIQDTSIMREQMVRIGQRPAFERTANLLCEMAHRLTGTELQLGEAFLFPIGQATLASALGMSPVHTNRILKQLRDANLAILSRQRLTILDLGGLRKAGHFDPSYLEPVRLNAGI